MTEETGTVGVEPPKIQDTLRAAWKTFSAHAQILVGSFAIFLGASVLLAVTLQLLGGALGWFFAVFVSLASFLPTLLLLPGLYLIALKAVRGQKPELADLFIMFKGRFIHHVGMLLLQSCGALVCFVGVIVTQALFIPGSFLVLDQKKDWDGAMEMCVEAIKPKIMAWIVFNLVLALVAFAGFLACFFGSLITGPVVLCAWAHAYEHSFSRKTAQ